MSEAVFLEWGKSPQGLPTAKLCRGSQKVSLHSYDPAREAQRLIAHFNPKLSWVLVAGSGLGYLIDEILSQTRFQVLAYDHDETLRDEALKGSGRVSLLKNPRVRWLSGDPARVPSVLEELGLGELNFYMHRPYAQIFPDLYNTLEGVVAAYLSRRQINRATLKRFQRVWLKNIVRNSASYFERPGIADIRHPFAGKPAVIVGAGPSLEKNVDLLRIYGDRALIISTDTALTVLESRGIRPDFVVSVDPQDKNTYYLLYSKFKNVPLVMDASASFMSILHYSPENTFFSDSPFPLYEVFRPFWGVKGPLISGGSVSTTAFDLARVFGADPIVLIGQDLSYSGKKTHVHGSILEEFLYYKIDRFHTYDQYNAGQQLFADRVEVEGYSGGRVLTDRKFLTYLEWFQREIKHTRARVINATEGGAKIEGAEPLSLGEVFGKIAVAPISKEFSAPFEKKPPDDFNFQLGKAREIAKNLLPSARDAADSAAQGLMMLGKGLSIASRKQALEPLVRKMNRFDSELLQSLKKEGPVGRLLEFTMQDSIERILSMPEAPDWTEETFREWEKFYTEAWLGLNRVVYLLGKSPVF